MSLYAQYETDPKLEKEGVNFEVPNADDPDLPPYIFKVARAGGANIAYTKAMERLAKPLRRVIANGQLTNVQALKMQQEAYAEAVVLGWENVPARDGSPLPFSKENALGLFKALPDLFNDIQEVATKSQVYLVEARADASKN